MKAIERAARALAVAGAGYAEADWPKLQASTRSSYELTARVALAAIREPDEEALRETRPAGMTVSEWRTAFRAMIDKVLAND